MGYTPIHFYDTTMRQEEVNRRFLKGESLDTGRVLGSFDIPEERCNDCGSKLKGGEMLLCGKCKRKNHIL